MPPRRPETINKIKNRTEKLCRSCSTTKPLLYFGKDRGSLDGRYSHCNECRKIRSKKDYEKRKLYIGKYTKEYIRTPKGKESRKKEAANYKKKINYKANYTVTNAVRDGRLIKPSICSRCGGGGKIHGHHFDYTKPLDVVWVCISCHQSIHKHEKHLIKYK